MAYIIVNDDHCYVYRSYIGSYAARDYFLPLHSEYGNRITATGALTYDKLEDAQGYIARNSKYMGPLHVCEYNTCCNSVGGVVS